MGRPVSTSCLFQKKVLRPPPRFQKKKGKERKGKFGWIRSIFLQKIGGQNVIVISRVFCGFSLSELYVDPQLIEYIPKSDARALRRKGRLERNKRDFEPYYYYYDDDDKT